ncbi:hypothetical protein [Paludisphaera mucosa]|uniref:Uncharacterized protein n=1 Tax=Paludisphaera mucosa TaxID=3030827 RepID=A0ABT6FFG4_9BACT|nr:hypothetical protein [Paludisphaera mucosa]MDG3006130.1 hypothetical protein [Paludisphaera mucosa]
MKPTRILTLIFLALYIGACVFPAICTYDGENGPPNYFYGWTCLAFGWMPPWSFAWLANPIMLAGWLAYVFHRYRTARVLGLAAFIAALGVWYFFQPKNLYSGYFLWQASTVALTACAHLAAEAVTKREAETLAQPVATPA